MTSDFRAPKASIVRQFRRMPIIALSVATLVASPMSMLAQQGSADFFTVRGENTAYRISSDRFVIRGQVELALQRERRALEILTDPDRIDPAAAYWVAEDGYALLRSAHYGVMQILNHTKYPSPLWASQSEMMERTRQFMYALNGPLVLLERGRTRDPARLTIVTQQLRLVVEQIELLLAVLP